MLSYFCLFFCIEGMGLRQSWELRGLGRLMESVDCGVLELRVGEMFEIL